MSAQSLMYVSFGEIIHEVKVHANPCLKNCVSTCRSHVRSKVSICGRARSSLMSAQSIIIIVHIYMGRFYMRLKFTHKSLLADCASGFLLHGKILHENLTWHKIFPCVIIISYNRIFITCVVKSPHD